MAIKNVIQENRIQMNKFSFQAQPGVGAITLVSIGELAKELDKADLPDRTSRSGGRVKQATTELVQPAHHDLEVLAMDAWFAECQDPVTPTHLKIVTIVKFDQAGLPRRVLTLTNCWLSNKVESEMDLDNDGDQATITWTLEYDNIL